MLAGLSMRRWGAALLLVSCAASSDLLQRLSRAHFDFTLGMYTTLVNVTDDRQQNLLVSPYSVFSLLSMLFLGAGSESLSSAQLRAVLRFHNISYASVQKAFKEVTQVLDQPYYWRHFRERSLLQLSSQVAPDSIYVRALAEYYGCMNQTYPAPADDAAEFFGCAVNNQSELAEPAAFERLAAWLRAGSSGDQSELEGAVRSALADRPVLLLLSRVRFHGRWLHPFDPARTFSKGLFFSEPTQRLEVPMMTGRLRVPLGYSADMEARVLELPLVSRRISIFLLLPDDMERGLALLEANLTMDNLRTLLATLKEAVVNVKLPRFRLEDSGDLRTVLMSQGLTDVFDPRSADLTGIDPQGRVHPGNLFYSTSLVLDESVEASDWMGDRMAPPTDSRITDKYFEVDHPFVFLVWDYHSAMVLLMGRVVHPQPLYQQ
ncbi:leukocyte elastase inhibitor-like [Amphibalanus amphitrite]|uniref:leukocyte elastase inhibitor-like n=1 Tax=Amphibalanus amphitrite TaxID=1232801 RepID=UPI001C8FFB8A|nr:leukocyte elastase inhibitor-like [Amphibalanus amphitrite]